MEKKTKHQTTDGAVRTDGDSAFKDEKPLEGDVGLKKKRAAAGCFDDAAVGDEIVQKLRAHGGIGRQALDEGGVVGEQAGSDGGRRHVEPRVLQRHRSTRLSAVPAHEPRERRSQRREDEGQLPATPSDRADPPPTLEKNYSKYKVTRNARTLDTH